MLALVLGWSAAAAVAGGPADELAAWQAVRPGIRLGVEAGGLRVAGRIEDGWNYVRSPVRPLAPDSRYRLAARLTVERLGDGTPPPYLKCEMLDADGQSLGRASTTSYRIAETGAAQEVSVTFVPPKEAASCWLALEKGTDGPCVISAVLHEVRLEVIEPAVSRSLRRPYALEPVPEPLERMRGVHPRLYADAARFAELRAACATTHQTIAERILAHADRLAAAGPPAYRAEPDGSGNEQLWQRGVGNAMPYLALAWRLTGERKYLDGAAGWAVASAGYRTWGLGATDGMDLATGHQMLGLALVYDWCRDDLAPAARDTIREALIRRGTAQYEAAAAGRAWWEDSYLQNHLWVNATGLCAAGLALWDEHPPAGDWIAFARDRFATTMRSLGDDGASHEGIGYWQYGVEYLLKFMELARPLLGDDLYDHQWWRSTADYALYLTLPRAAWSPRSSLVDIADCPRGNWYGPDYLLRRLAAEYRNPVAQWQAEQVEQAGIGSMEAAWLNLLWYDPSLPPEPPEARPRLHWFRDMDLVSVRSGWTGEESVVVAKCGPFIGHQAIQQFDSDPGGGHVHPDAGHFVVFGEGEWLIRDDGYQDKWTAQHNTLLVDGRGQLGEGRQWFAGGECLQRRARPRIVRVDSTAGEDQILCDATEAYPPECGIQRFQRTLRYLRPNALVVDDDILCDRPRDLELRFHTESPLEQIGSAFVAAGERSIVRIECLTPEGVGLAAETIPLAGRHGAGGQGLATVRLTRNTAAWRNVTAITWCSAGAELPRVRVTAAGDSWQVAVER